MYAGQEVLAVDVARLKGIIAMTPDPMKNKNESAATDSFVIESRFGAITVSKEHSLFFPQGLLGLPPKLHFAITDIPQKNMGQFKLLQCLNDHSISFIVLPIDIDNTIIAREDLLETCEILHVQEHNLLTLLIISVQRSPDGVKVTANARAPVIIDVADKAAVQYVFPHGKYEITHPLIK